MPTGPHMQPLGFEAIVTGETVTLVLSGELDIGNERLLSYRLAQIQQEKSRRLVFEMAEVGFVDCASMRLIVGTGRWLPQGVRPVISYPSPVVRRVLQLTGLDALCGLRE